MDRRSLFYWSMEFTGGLAKGEDYSLLSNVIAINIVNFEAVAIDEYGYSDLQGEGKMEFLANDREVLRL